MKYKVSKNQNRNMKAGERSKQIDVPTSNLLWNNGNISRASPGVTAAEAACGGTKYRISIYCNLRYTGKPLACFTHYAIHADFVGPASLGEYFRYTSFRSPIAIPVCNSVFLPIVLI